MNDCVRKKLQVGKCWYSTETKYTGFPRVICYTAKQKNIFLLNFIQSEMGNIFLKSGANVCQFAAHKGKFSPRTYSLQTNKQSNKQFKKGYKHLYPT